MFSDEYNFLSLVITYSCISFHRIHELHYPSIQKRKKSNCKANQIQDSKDIETVVIQFMYPRTTVFSLMPLMLQKIKMTSIPIQWQHFYTRGQSQTAAVSRGHITQPLIRTKGSIPAARMRAVRWRLAATARGTHRNVERLRATHHAQWPVHRGSRALLLPAKN